MDRGWEALGLGEQVVTYLLTHQLTVCGCAGHARGGPHRGLEHALHGHRSPSLAALGVLSVKVGGVQLWLCLAEAF